MKWFIKCMQHYADFKGRARRKEYWYFALFSMLLLIVAMVVDRTLLGIDRLPWLYYIVALAILIPGLAVWTRRIHDTDRSGWHLVWFYLAYIFWVILLFVFGIMSFLMALASGATLADLPSTFLVLLLGGALVFFVWGIVFLVWLCTKGTPGDNKYGPDPLAEKE